MHQQNRFKKGSGAYACKQCARQTRDTGDNGDLRLCPDCYDLCGYVNQRSDYGSLNASELEEAERLIASLQARGGSAAAVAEFRKEIFQA